MKRSVLLLALCVLGLSGCEWLKGKSSKDNLDPPAELVDFETTAPVDRRAVRTVVSKDDPQMLKDAVQQYVFISSISVYKDTSGPIDESTAVVTLADPTVEKVGEQHQVVRGEC